MKLALVRDFEIYDRDLLGLKLRDRIRLTLERVGFNVQFVNDDGEISIQPAEAFLIIVKPVLILERDLELTGKRILVSDGVTFGYLFEKDFFELAKEMDLEQAIGRYLQNCIETQHVWALILTEDNLKLAEGMLLKSLIKARRVGSKSVYYDGIISRTINRRISLRISKYLARKNVTPNQISVLSFILSLIGSSMFLFGSYITNLIAGILVQLSSIIDGCDGEIARLKFMESKFGAWLDLVLDRCEDFLIILFITISLAQTNEIYWILGFIAAFATFMIPYTGDRYTAVYGQPYAPKSFSIPITRDVRIFLIFLGAIFNALVVALALIALLGNFETLRRIVELR